MSAGTTCRTQVHDLTCSPETREQLRKLRGLARDELQEYLAEQQSRRERYVLLTPAAG
jgi:hypothetical protein